MLKTIIIFALFFVLVSFYLNTRKIIKKVGPNSIFGHLQILLICFWLKHHRLTGPILFVCKKVTLRSGCNKITLEFKDYFDFKTFREVFFEGQYKFEDDSNLKLIVDLGGNVGYSAAYFFLAYPEAHIITVEPNPVSNLRIEKMFKNISRIEVKKVAVGNKNENILLHLVGDQSASASLVEREGNTQSVSIKSITFSELIKDVEFVDLLKVDIEGSEIHVLSDAAISKVNRIIAEIHPDLVELSEEKVIVMLKDFQCTIKGINNGRFLVDATRRLI